MVYWFFGFLLIAVLIVIAGIIKKRVTSKAKLAEIKASWGSPKEEKRSFTLIARYLQDTGGDYSASAGDLDLDDVFSYIDRTNSRPGQQFLYKKLHSPEISEPFFSKLEKRIALFSGDEQLREQTEAKLSSVSDHEAYYLSGLFSHNQQSLFSPLTLFYIRFAAPAVILLIYGLFLYPNPVFAMLLLACIIANVIIHYSNKSKMVRYTHTLPQLHKLISTGEWLFNNKLLDEDNGIQQDLEKLSKLKKSLGFVNVQNTIAADPTSLSYLFSEWLKILLMLEPFNFVVSLNQVNKYPKEIRRIFESVGEVDMAISIQSVRMSLPHYCLPEFLQQSQKIVITDLYHPLIENCVLNSIRLDSSQGALITGSNMSGKTTFIRAIAINALLSQTIHTSFAREYKAPLLRIFTSINMTDDLGADTSYYQAEALSIRNIIRNSAASKPINSLVIIDEIFRGTNTIERIAAAKAVLSYFIGNNNFAIVSTHDLELAQLLGNEYKVFSFEERAGGDQLLFDYKLKEGLLKNKNGIIVLKSLDYPQNIIDEAARISLQLRDKYDL